MASATPTPPQKTSKPQLGTMAEHRLQNPLDAKETMRIGTVRTPGVGQYNPRPLSRRIKSQSTEIVEPCGGRMGHRQQTHIPKSKLIFMIAEWLIN